MLHGIFTYIWVSFRTNVGNYCSTMEHLGTVDTFWSMSHEPGKALKKSSSAARRGRGHSYDAFEKIVNNAVILAQQKPQLNALIKVLSNEIEKTMVKVLRVPPDVKLLACLLGVIHIFGMVSFWEKDNPKHIIKLGATT